MNFRESVNSGSLLFFSKSSERMMTMEFSKKIVVGFLIFVAIVLAMSFFLMYKTSDISPLNEIIIGTSAIGMSIFSFYFWKSKSENIVKIAKQHGEEIANKIKDIQ